MAPYLLQKAPKYGPLGCIGHIRGTWRVHSGSPFKGSQARKKPVDLEVYDTEVHITRFTSGVLVKGRNGGKQAHQTMVFTMFYDMHTRVSFVRCCFLFSYVDSLDARELKPRVDTSGRGSCVSSVYTWVVLQQHIPRIADEAPLKNQKKSTFSFL